MTTLPARWKLAIGIAGGLAAGLLSAPFVMDDTQQTPALVLAPATPAVAASCSAVSVAAITAEVRRVTREELVAFGNSLSVDAARETAAAPPDPAHIVAATRARSLLDGAIGRRRWTDVDADSLRAEMADLPAGQRAEIIRSLSVAINQGQVVPESDRLPF